MDACERGAAFSAAGMLFDQGLYLAAHELFEELWEASEGGDADFYKGLIQAAIALHHFQAGNLEGAAKLYLGHRRCLAPFAPRHGGLDLARFLGEMQACLRPILERVGDERVAFDFASRPRLLSGDSPDTASA
jgi:hypothetical protein